MSKKLFLLDAMALVFRAYYALIRSPRITSKGKNTNAQFGFTNTLLDLINNQKPSHMAVCFDTEAPTERHTDFTDYKANRQEAPEDILASIFSGIPFHVLEKRGLRFQCKCGRHRIERVLISLGCEELKQLASKEEQVEVKCEFCGSAYCFSREQIENLIREMGCDQ